MRVYIVVLEGPYREDGYSVEAVCPDTEAAEKWLSAEGYAKVSESVWKHWNLDIELPVARILEREVE